MENRERTANQSFLPPGPAPTPFYIALRQARHVNLCFIIPGFQGEALDVQMRTIDLAFVLEQTLKRRGWGDVTISRAVNDFLEKSMVEVQWRGKDGVRGLLE